MLATKWNNVLYAVNAIGRDDRHYTVMMMHGHGTVLARRHFSRTHTERLFLKRYVHPDLRSEETLRYIAWLKGFVTL